MSALARGLGDFACQAGVIAQPQGFLDGFTFRRVGAELGVTPFGMSIIDMPPETAAYPEHDHSSVGPGNPPAHQLGQEEVHIALRGSADVEVDGRRYPVDAGQLIRVGPTARRKIWPALRASGSWRSGGTPAKRTTEGPPSERASA